MNVGGGPVRTVTRLATIESLSGSFGSSFLQELQTLVAGQQVVAGPYARTLLEETCSRLGHQFLDDSQGVRARMLQAVVEDDLLDLRAARLECGPLAPSRWSIDPRPTLGLEVAADLEELLRIGRGGNSELAQPES